MLGDSLIYSRVLTIRSLKVLILYFMSFHTLGRKLSYLMANLITEYLPIYQPKSIWESLLVLMILIFLGSMQLKPLIQVIIIFTTIIFRAATTLHIASTNLN